MRARPVMPGVGPPLVLDNTKTLLTFFTPFEDLSV
jgi:hypothetical protein